MATVAMCGAINGVKSGGFTGATPEVRTVQSLGTNFVLREASLTSPIGAIADEQGEVSVREVYPHTCHAVPAFNKPTSFKGRLALY